MNKYEGLFVLNTAGKEEGIKEMIDKITNDLTSAGAKVENIQKMEKRSFSRIKKKNQNSGYYVNIIFEAKPELISQFRTKFGLNEDIFRVLFTQSQAAGEQPQTE